MTFPSTWEWQVGVTSQNAQVDSNESNFPYYLDLSLITSTDFWDNVQSDGGDLRVTSDSSGDTQVPLEVVSIQRLKDGLVSYYDFEAGSGTTLNDRVGTTDGTVSGATWVTGKLGSNALSFDGTNDEVSGMPVMASASDFSWGMWVKFPTIGNEETIFSQYPAAGSGASDPLIRILKNSSNAFVAQIAGNGRTGSTALATATGSTTTSVDTWYHISLTYKQTTGALKLYVNGALEDTATYSGGSWSDIDTASLAKFIGGATNYYEVIIDEFGIWNRALSAKDVELLYNNSNGRQYADFTGTGEIHFKDSTDSASDKTYYLWWRDTGSAESQPAVSDTYGRNNVWTECNKVMHLEELSGPVADSTGNADGTNNGATTGVTGKIGNAYSFDGTNDYVNTQLAPSNFNIGSASLWYNGTDATTNSLIGTIAEKGANDPAVIIWSDASGYGNLQIRDTSGNVRTLSATTGSINNGAWHQIVCTWSSGDMKIYVDGSQVQSGTATFGTVDLSSYPVFLGAYNDRGGGATNFKTGNLDEFRTFDTQISAGWIGIEYNMQSDNATFWSVGTPEAPSLGVNNSFFYGGGL